jgi:hypothetical protein
MWQTINFDCISIYKKNETESSYAYENLSKSNKCISNIESLSFRSVLDDKGELKILDNNNDYVWSNLFVREKNYHMRYAEPLVYSISSCHEELRLPYLYELNSYPEPDHDPLIVIDPYFNNLLPNEKILSVYN